VQERASGTTAALCLGSTCTSASKKGREESVCSAADVLLVGTSDNKAELFIGMVIE